MHGMSEREERKHGGKAEHEREREHEREEHEREHRAEGGETVHTKMEMDHPTDKAGGREHHRRPRRAKGGESHVPVHMYNAVGSPEEKEITEDEDGFSHGGRKRRRHGGEAKGEHAEHRADKHPRGRRKAGGPALALATGGAASALKLRHGGKAEHEREEREEHEHRARGGSVYSTGAKLSPLKSGDAASRGHEGQKVPEEPGPG